MPDGTTPRERLTELIELARTYRGWTRRKLAKSLGRDASKLVPESGLPKIDLVIELARVLDWPVQDVVNSLGEDLAGGATAVGDDDSFDALNAASFEAYKSGDYAEMVSLAQRAYAVATTPTERARACNREAGGWDGQGHYRRGLEPLQRGLREVNATTEWQLLLRSNLANQYYMLWQIVEGRGIATDVLAHFSEHPPSSIPERIAQATSYYVRGNCNRRQLNLKSPDVRQTAQRACDDLTTASGLYESLATDVGAEAYRWIGHTCRGAMLEMAVVLERRSADEALQEITAELDKLSVNDDDAVGDELESYSWWCIFGCNIVIRHCQDAAQIQRTMAVLTAKADELAERLGNWALRERVLTMDFVRRQRLGEWAGLPPEWTLDSDDVRLITGTMGRFPFFRKTGWEILRSAQQIRDK